VRVRRKGEKKCSLMNVREFRRGRDEDRERLSAYFYRKFPCQLSKKKKEVPLTGRQSSTVGEKRKKQKGWRVMLTLLRRRKKARGKSEAPPPKPKKESEARDGIGRAGGWLEKPHSTQAKDAV